jgi:hypothetical protein
LALHFSGFACKTDRGENQLGYRGCQLLQMAVGGAIIGYAVPVLRPHQGAFLATEAASSLGLYLSKSIVFNASAR